MDPAPTRPFLWAMFPKRVSLVCCGAFLLVTWNAILVLLLLGRGPPGEAQPGAAEHPTADMVGDVIRIADAFESELKKQKDILKQILRHRPLWQPTNRTGPKAVAPGRPVIPILVIACNRVTVRRCVDKLLQLRPAADLHPIVVSQDCGHAETAEVIRSYGDRVTHLRQPDLSDVPVPLEHRKFQGYYKISRHYRWALNQVFRNLTYSSVVVVEDDLEVTGLHLQNNNNNIFIYILYIFF